MTLQEQIDLNAVDEWKSKVDDAAQKLLTISQMFSWTKGDGGKISADLVALIDRLKEAGKERAINKANEAFFNKITKGEK